MPIAKSVTKMQKKKSTQSLHPKGRKFKQMQSALHREQKLQKQSANKSKIEDQILEKYIFAQEAVKLFGKPQLEIPEVVDICDKFVNRNKPELDELAKERKERPNRPPSNKYLSLKALYDNEMKEFEQGFEFVDLTNEETVKNLINWNRSWGGLNMLKTITVTKNQN